MERLFRKAHPTYLSGIVMDEHNAPLSRARVECLDANTNTVLAHVSTNKLGKFYLRNREERTVNLEVTKEGYTPQRLHAQLLENGLRIVMKPGVKTRHTFLSALATQIEAIAGLGFEFVLVLSFIIECFFLTLFPVAATIPFLLLSFLNILLWLFYLRERFEQRLGI
jgi:hypothetical protein